MLLAANHGVSAAGVVMIAPQGRRLAQLLHDQYRLALSDADVTRVDSAFARYLRGENPGDAPPAAAPVLVPANRNYMRSWAAYDPAAEVRRLNLPLLIMRGSTDVQVSLLDAEALAAAQPRSTLVRLDGVNHVLKPVSSNAIDEQTKSLRSPNVPLASSVVPAIVAWLELQKP